MRRTAWAVLAMCISFLLGTIIAVGSLVSMGGRLDTERLTAAPLSVPTVLVSCLDPLAIVLEIAAIVLIVIDSKQVGNPHRRLARTAAILFVLWGVLNLGVFLPLSFAGMQRGSLALVKTGQMVKAGAALLQYAIPFLLVYGLSGEGLRGLLWLALLLTVVGNFAVVVLPMGSIELVAIQAAGRELYVPQFSVDYTRGLYSVLLGMGYAGGVLYMITYGYLAAKLFRSTASVRS
jgi:hypothetical protein